MRLPPCVTALERVERATRPRARSNLVPFFETSLTQQRLSHRRICCLIIGPTFFSAALYWAGGIIIQNVARDKSWLSGKWFKTVYLTADVVSLVIQAVGGGMAGSAVGTDNYQQSENGSKCVALPASTRSGSGSR